MCHISEQIGDRLLWALVVIPTVIWLRSAHWWIVLLLCLCQLFTIWSRSCHNYTYTPYCLLNVIEGRLADSGHWCAVWSLQCCLYCEPGQTSIFVCSWDTRIFSKSLLICHVWNVCLMVAMFISQGGSCANASFCCNGILRFTVPSGFSLQFKDLEVKNWRPLIVSFLLRHWYST